MRRSERKRQFSRSINIAQGNKKKLKNKRRTKKRGKKKAGERLPVLMRAMKKSAKTCELIKKNKNEANRKISSCRAKIERLKKRERQEKRMKRQKRVNSGLFGYGVHEGKDREVEATSF